MRSQEALSCPRRAPRRRVLLALLMLGWLIGLALALQHRIGHAGGHGAEETHALGGEHHDGDGTCVLADQAGLGEALPNAAAVLPASAIAAAPALRPPTPRPVAAPWRPYEARAPPPG